MPFLVLDVVHILTVLGVAAATLGTAGCTAIASVAHGRGPYVDGDSQRVLEVNAGTDGVVHAKAVEKCRRRDTGMYEDCRPIGGAPVRMFGGVQGREFNVIVGSTDPKGELDFQLADKLPESARVPLALLGIPQAQPTTVNIESAVRSNVARTRAADHANVEERFRRVAGDCGPQASSTRSCDDVVDLLKRTANMYPNDEVRWTADLARETLKSAKPRFAALRCEEEFARLDVTTCAHAAGPAASDIRKECKALAQFVDHYPTDARAVDLRAVLVEAGTRISALDAKEHAEAEQEARKEEAAEQQREVKRITEQQSKCLGVCRYKCSSSPRFDDCYGGCSTLCQ